MQISMNLFIYSFFHKDCREQCTKILHCCAHDASLELLKGKFISNNFQSKVGIRKVRCLPASPEAASGYLYQASKNAVIYIWDLGE